MPSCTLLLLLALCSGALASHFYGGTATFSPKGKNPDGSFKMDFRYKQTFDGCYQGNTWYCDSGDCGNIIHFEIGEVDRSTVSYGRRRWCQSEALMTLNIPTNRPFQMRKTGCCWIYNSVNSGSWRLLTHVDLGIRSDTREPNRSPVTTILPFIRIPQNCPRTFNLLAHDPDKDQVRCRYGNAYSNECSYCSQHPGFHLDQSSCSLTYQYNLTLDAHALEIVLEDFPKQQITLSYSDGSVSIKSPQVARQKQWAFTATTKAAPMTVLPHTTTLAIMTALATSTTKVPKTALATSTTKVPKTALATSTTEVPKTALATSTTKVPKTALATLTTKVPKTALATSTTEVPLTTLATSTTEVPLNTLATLTREVPLTTLAHMTTSAPLTAVAQRTASGPMAALATATPALTSRTQNSPMWAWLQTEMTASTITPSTVQWQQPTKTSSTPAQPFSTGPISKIPLQFAIQVDPPVHSCTEGEILPRFLYPTPANGQILNASVNQELEIWLKATAAQSSVNNFIISGPLNITKYNTIIGSVGESLIRWTPTENDFGDHVPICFIAESQNGSRIFHSEMRCIIVIVGLVLGNAHVVCNETTMTVEVEKISVKGLHEDHLRLNDPSCTPISNSTHVIAAMSLSSCGTQLEEDADNLIFKNEMISYQNFGDVITRMHQVAIGFSCTYPKKGHTSLEFRAHKIPYVFTEKGFGKFTYQFEFFHSSLFNSIVDPQTYPIEVSLKQMLYMEIKATSSLPNTELFVESCRATPVDDPNYPIFYDIFNNGCPVDETVVIYSRNSTEFRFGIEAFKFIGQHEEVFISCSVILCEAGDPYTRCSQGCINATASPVVHHHHKRAVAAETDRHSISQGPLHLKKTRNFIVSNMGLNMNLVFISAVLLVVVVIVCGAVIYTKTRSNFRYQRLPSTDF